MKIILSPAKKMKVDTDSMEPAGLPEFLDQAKAVVCGHKNLYELWGSRLYEAVRDSSGLIVNLASGEYSRCIERYLTQRDRFITITFCEKSDGKLVTKGTYAKMARGDMVRFLAEEKIEEPGELRRYGRLGYVFRESLSTETEYVYERMKTDSLPSAH